MQKQAQEKTEEKVIIAKKKSFPNLVIILAGSFVCLFVFYFFNFASKESKSNFEIVIVVLKEERSLQVRLIDLQK
jgi:pyrrolidone-carboxylate peptidase